MFETENRKLIRFFFACRYICLEDWPEERQNYYYSIALMALQFIFPLLVLVFTYTRIAVAVWGKRPPGEAENSRDQRMARSKRKVSGKFGLWTLS
jgi:RYamide receptor